MSAAQEGGDAKRSIAAVRENPIIALLSVIFTIFIVVVLFCHMTKRIELDGWDIALFGIALLPWTFHLIISAAEDIGKALKRGGLKSLQLGIFKIEQLEKKVVEQAEKIDEQRRILDDLALYSMAFYIYDKLKYLYFGTLSEHVQEFGEYKYVKNDLYDHDLRYLRDHGYLELFQISQLIPGENLVGKLKVTEMGRRFVELKEARLSQLQIEPPPAITGKDISRT